MFMVEVKNFLYKLPNFTKTSYISDEAALAFNVCRNLKFKLFKNINENLKGILGTVHCP